MRRLLPLSLIILILAVIGIQCTNTPQGDSIIIQKDGKLFLMNETGVEIKTLNITPKVFDFIWINPDLLVYTSLNMKNLDVYKHDMQNNSSQKVAQLTPQSSNETYWRSDFWSGMVHSGNKIYIDCDFREDFPYGFFRKSVFQVDLSNGKTQLFNSEKDFPKLQTLMITDSSKFKYNSKQDSLLKKLSIGSNCELYYAIGDSVRRISNTPIEKDTMNGPCMIFDVNQKANKVLFSPSVGCGDFCHGPIYFVNLDGTDQQLIANDRVTSKIFASKQTGFTFIIEGEYDGSNFKNLEIKAVTNTNKPKLLMPNIQKAGLCETNVWYFFSNQVY